MGFMKLHVWLLVAAAALWGDSVAFARVWTDVRGNTLEGEFVRMVGDNVMIKLRSGQRRTYPYVGFSEEDREYVKSELNARGQGFLIPRLPQVPTDGGAERFAGDSAAVPAPGNAAVPGGFPGAPSGPMPGYRPPPGYGPSTGLRPSPGGPSPSPGVVGPGAVPPSGASPYAGRPGGPPHPGAGSSPMGPGAPPFAGPPAAPMPGPASVPPHPASPSPFVEAASMPGARPPAFDSGPPQVSVPEFQPVSVPRLGKECRQCGRQYSMSATHCEHCQSSYQSAYQVGERVGRGVGIVALITLIGAAIRKLTG